ncbi:hypothetical protein CEP68_02575 [Brevundimonas vesicularis]|uniref:Tip attachment protein J domain-containing protein n=1 Tax=Brevundimonas vesicularis TaxID=41276 RepID=A0A1Z3U5B4_BREVE|nr:hypothetical protein CEP68_02575 [Brevundimonas vesicularis]
MVAAWAATAWTSAVTVTAGALASVGAVAAIGEGATIALASGILKTAAITAISAAATALMRPNTPSSGTTLDFKPDPKAPVRGAMGFTAVGGNKVFQATWGYKRVAMSLGVALSLGPIQSVAAFEADGSTVAFNPANQYEALGFYDSDMWQRTTLGLPGDAALLPPTGLKYGTPGLTGWGLQNAAPQTAFAFWTMVLAKNPEDRDIFTNGVPDPRWILNGMRLWQPRYDSTYPGGSGPQRRDDWRTWGWSENPYDHALAWVRGHYKLNTDGSIDKTKRIAGVGAPDSAIDIPAFVEGANIADANGWTISGEWSTSDGKWQTLVAMLQAGGGQPINRGAQISVLVNAPRVSTYTYTKSDLVGQAQIKPLTPRRDRKNTIIPRYRSQPNGWEYVAAGEVTASTYRTEDRGEQRSTEVEYVHVRDARQAGQLAAYDLVNLREGLTATLPSKVHLMSVHAGDCITVDVPELALANQKFVVMRTTVDYKSAGVTLELRSETDAKHAFALGQTGQAPPSPSLSAVDPRYIAPPVADDWSVVPQPPSGGTTQPIVIVIGKTEVGDAASIIVETGPSATGPWSTVYSGTPLLDGRYPSPGLQPGQQYWVSVRYVAKNGAISDRLIQGPITASQLVAGDVSPTAPGLSQIKSDIEAAFGDIFDIDGLLTQARTDIDAQGTEIVAARGGQPSLNSRIVQVNQLRIDGDTSNAQAISLVQARTANTEADIIDLENAVSTETAARAQAIQQVTARQAIRPNLVVNSTAAQGMQGLTNFGSRTVVAYPAAPDGPQWAADAGGGSGLSFGARWASRPAKAGFPYSLQAELGGFGMTSGQVRAVGVFRNAGGGVTGYIVATAFYDAFAGGYVLRRTENVIAPAETVSYDLQIDVDDGAFTSGGSVGWKRVKLEQGPVCTLWSDDASDVEMSASVTQQSLAIIDLENQQNIALWRIKAEASGSRPAIIEAYSGLGVSALAFSAEQLYLGDNTVFDDATNTWQTIDGSTVYIRAEGAPFGAFSNLREWWGPTGIALGAMTPDNGYSGRMTTAPYNFTNTLNPRTFSAYASPGSIEAHRSDAGSLTSAAVSILYQNAKGAVSVTWERLIGGVTAAGTAVIDAPNELTTTFTKTVSAQERTDTVFQATLTDAGSGERRQVIVPVVFTSGAA